MNVYQTAMMLAGQFYLVLEQDDTVPVGSVKIVPQGADRGIYYNPADYLPDTVNLG